MWSRSDSRAAWGGRPAGGRAGVVARALLLACVLLPTPPAAGQPPTQPLGEGELRAQQIGEDDVDLLRIGGPDAIGGIGDWYLANDVVEAIVDDVSRRHAKLNHGGTLIDVGLRDRRDEDQFARLIPMANMSQRVFLDYDSIRAEVDERGGVARIVVSSPRLRPLPRGGGLARLLDPTVPEGGALSGVRVETEYRVVRGEPYVRVTTTFRNEGAEEAPLFAFGDLWMRGGRSLPAFVGNALDPETAPGFHHPKFDARDPRSSGAALSALTHVVAPGVGAYPPIAYALVAPERSARGRPLFGMTGEHVSMTFAFVGDPPWSRPTLLRMLRGLARGLAPGESWIYRRRILVTGRSDVASATDELLPLLGVDARAVLTLRVDPPDVPVALHVASAAGHPVTVAARSGAGAGKRLESASEEAGGLRMRLPEGTYDVIARAPHRAPSTHRVRVPAEGSAELVLPSLPPIGHLEFARPFADGGPGRVIVRGLGGTPDPTFGDELFDFRLDGIRPSRATESRSLYFVGGGADVPSVSIAPGRYRLVAVRGLEFDIASIEVDVAPGAVVSVPPFELTPVVELRDWARADLHVHAQASDDSGTPNAMRLRQFVAAGIDVVVATDHDNVPDYLPALRGLDLARSLTLIHGVEVTSSTPSFAAPWTIGHHNAWPLERRPDLHRGGAPPSQERTLAELYADLRSHPEVRVIQLNHARDGTYPEDAGAFFSHLGEVGRPFDPLLPVTAEPNRVLLAGSGAGGRGLSRGIDFDAMEVMNGPDWEGHRSLRQDWYALLRQGFQPTATANSDTHSPQRPAGFPRNYVRVGGPAGRRSTRVDPERFDRALLDGRAFGTSGPLVVHFAVNGARIGDLVEAPRGRVLVEYDVVAAPWVPLDEVRLVVNGEVVRVRQEPYGYLELDLSRDAFLTLEAGAPRDVDGHAWRSAHPGPYTEDVAPGYVSAAFTNPIYVDVDEDGVFDPPGLPPAPRTALARGLATGAAAIAVLALVRWRRRRIQS